MTNLNIFNPRDQLGLKFFPYCILDQQTGGRRAALTINRIDHEDHRIQCTVKIGIFEYNNRVFATQLKVISFMCISALLCNQRPRTGLPNEGDCLNLRMLA